MKDNPSINNLKVKHPSINRTDNPFDFGKPLFSILSVVSKKVKGTKMKKCSFCHFTPRKSQNHDQKVLKTCVQQFAHFLSSKLRNWHIFALFHFCIKVSIYYYFYFFLLLKLCLDQRNIHLQLI